MASRAGRRVAVVDQPQVVPSPDLNGVQVFEWGLHDRNFSIASSPPELLDDLRSRHGDHPVSRCDRMHGCTPEGYRHLLDALVEGARRKTGLALDVLGREHWDLMACAFGESHCVGHHFWHLFDTGHPKHDPELAAELGDAILSVYRRIDEGVGELAAAAGPDAAVLVVASHGMGPKLGGPQLLPEVLVRLDMAGAVRAPVPARSFVPAPLRRLVRQVLPTRSLDRLPVDVGPRSLRLNSPHKKATAVRNNRCGGIRLNVKGREPYGCLSPGVEVDGVIEELRRELLALTQPESGETIVERVVTAQEAFGDDRHPDLPDVMVVFRTDLGPLEACWSRRAGLVEAPTLTRALPRTGDHTVESRLWAAGPGVPAGVRLPDANVLDIAPTVLDLLDVEAPGRLDGRPIAGLVSTAPTG